ncbi:glycosyltransferase, partial [Spirochaetota bacterium]
MKQNLLITAADNNFIDQAKQLFSCVYFNAGWDGDYMLLAQEIPEKGLKWFRDKGILVKKCKPVSTYKFTRLPSTPLIKFYMFTDEFKKWNNIVYLDADVIVRASLNDLVKIKNFASVDNFIEPKLGNQIFELKKTNRKSYYELEKRYNLNKKSFCSGVMAFNTKIIEEDTFYHLNRLLEKYYHGAFVDQAILNLYFYGKWEKLPYVFDIQLWSMLDHYHADPKYIKGIVLHFTGENKAWLPENYFYKEWKYNLNKANQINLNKQLPAK